MEERAGRPIWLRYGVAIVLVMLAVLLTLILRPWLSATLLAAFYGAVALSAWYSGLGPATLAIVLSLIAIGVWEVEPTGAWPMNSSDALILGTFAVVSILITALSASRDRAEAALRASERRFRAMLETANEGVWLINREARTQYANDRMAALLGTTGEQTEASSVLDFVFPEDVAAARTHVETNLAGRAEEFDFRFLRPDGEEVDVLAATSPVRDRTGRVVGALGLYTDITARRRAEADLARANERFALAADAVQAMIYEWDLSTGRVERSTGLLPLLGYRPDEVPGDQHWWHSLIHPDDRERIASGSVVDEAEDNRYSREYRVRHRDGRWIAVWDQGRLVRDRQGQVVRVIGSTIDITARTEAENALRLLDEAGRTLASALDYEETLQRVAWVAVPQLADWCAVDLLDGKGIARRVAVAHTDPAKADQAARLLDYAPSPTLDGLEEQAIRGGTSLFLERVSDDDIASVAQNAEHLEVLRGLGIISMVVVALQAGGQVHGAMTLATTTASNRRLDSDDFALAEQLGRRAAVAIQNAQLYRHAQEAEARYRGLFEGTKDGIIVFDTDGTCVDVNPAMAEMVGYSRDELVGRPAMFLASGGPWSGDEGKRLRQDGQWRGEFSLRSKQGQLVPVESWITMARLPTGPAYVGVLRDTSERKHLEAMHEEFIAAVAHDLKNPLTSVRGQSQLLRRRLDRGEPIDRLRLRAALEGIDSAGSRMTRQLDELTDVMRLRAGREVELEPKPTDLVALARRAVEEHDRATERHTIRLVTEEKALVGVWDGPRLERVLGNLLGNAIKYSPAGGEITVRVAREGTGDAAQAALSVADRGVGIPAADLDRIFERFQRGRNVERFAGSGIGLAGAKRIVERHGGTISVTSTEGQGSTFMVRLPLAEEHVAIGQTA